MKGSLEQTRPRCSYQLAIRGDCCSAGIAASVLQQSAQPRYLQFEFALFISQYLSHFDMWFFLHVSMHFSIEQEFV
jgi:hypothetical protein